MESWCLAALKIEKMQVKLCCRPSKAMGLRKWICVGK